MKKRKLNRREFGKLAGGAALLAPAGLTTLEGLAAPAPELAAAAPQQSESALKLSAEQEERVKQARERTERQMRGLRPKPIAYDAEPAFVFRAKAAAKPKT